MEGEREGERTNENSIVFQMGRKKRREHNRRKLKEMRWFTERKFEDLLRKMKGIQPSSLFFLSSISAFKVASRATRDLCNSCL